MSTLDLTQSPPSGVTWHVLDVMRKKRGRKNDWVALLISVSPVEHLREGYAFKRKWLQECWLDIGRAKTRDLAWDIAESRIATRH